MRYEQNQGIMKIVEEQGGLRELLHAQCMFDWIVERPDMQELEKIVDD